MKKTNRYQLGLEITTDDVSLIGMDHHKRITGLAALPYAGILKDGVEPDIDKFDSCILELSHYLPLSSGRLSIGLPINTILHSHFTLNEIIPEQEQAHFNQWTAQFFTNSPPKAFHQFCRLDIQSDPHHYDCYFLRHKILDSLNDIALRHDLSLSFVGLTIQRLFHTIQEKNPPLFDRNLLFVHGHCSSFSILCWYNHQTEHYFTLPACPSDQLGQEINDQLFTYNLQPDLFDLAVFCGDFEMQTIIRPVLKNQMAKDFLAIDIMDYLTLSDGIRSQLDNHDKLQSFIGAFSLL
ncbi:MAG: hypothetical protein KBA26_00625 [Candidatus Delongbacteria bacterium]|nr:hypothetical protein [Candidatus Delongbacteria bacterium]